MPDLISVGLDAQRRIVEFLQWYDNSRLACCSAALRDTVSDGRYPLWWGQAQSTSRDEDGLLASFHLAAKALAPAARPNFAMLMIDTAVLLETSTKLLCRRLHRANLVPVDCPMLVIDSHDGVFGAGAKQGEEGHFSQYEDRDIELDPIAPITAVLTVAYIPPEDVPAVPGRPGPPLKSRPRVSCFLADGQAQSPPYASASFVDDWEGLPPVWMESALPRDEIKPRRRTTGGRSSVGSHAAYDVSLPEAFEQRFCSGNNNANCVKPCCRFQSGEGQCAQTSCDSSFGRRTKSPRSRSADRAREMTSFHANTAHSVVDTHRSLIERVNSNERRDGGAGFSSDSGIRRSSSAGSNSFSHYEAVSDRADGFAAVRYKSMAIQQRSLRSFPQSAPRLCGGSRGSSHCRPRDACVLAKLKPPSSSVPLEGADTILLIGTHLDMLNKTSAWLGNALPNAVIMGGLSNCALVVGDEVYCRSELRKRSPFRTPKPLVVGLALRGVRALAVSAKGFGGVGPVFRVDSTIDGPSGNPQVAPGKILREVTVVSEGGGTRSSTAGAVFYDEVLSTPAWNENVSHGRQTVFLGVGWSPNELYCSTRVHGSSHTGARVGGCCGMGGRESAIRSEEATGLPPVSVNSVMGQLISLQDDVVPGQYARYMRTQAELSLADTEAAYSSCRQRIEREGGVALSSIHFTCAARPDRLEAVSCPTRRQGQENGQAADNDPAPVRRVMALHQQEVVRFCKTLKAPAAGMFCQGELGPLPTLVGGILPNACRSRLQAFSTCTAVLYWDPAPAE